MVCSFRPGAEELLTTGVAPSGTVQSRPIFETTPFTLAATGPDGHHEETVNGTVWPGPFIASFTVSATTIPQQDPVHLFWKVLDAAGAGTEVQIRAHETVRRPWSTEHGFEGTAALRLEEVSTFTDSSIDSEQSGQGRVQLRTHPL